ncbi:aminotransferase class IV [Myxococcota bacterium]|nr:aminotransferase class IV [Myxococcota bacterium]MBU1432291.1 aminotransferase class IV [Myxococcota bacterium]MBU1898587.1 aminotransferase class IV [Myxococcota bacterium]
MIWMNGAYHLAPPGLPLSDRGLLLGDGLFETLAALDGLPLRAEAHLARLWRGLEALGIESPYTQAELMDAMERVAGERDVSLRLTITRGAGPRGLTPPEVIKPRAWIAASPLSLAAGPMRAIISQERRAERSQLSQLKSLNRLQDVLARREAQAAGVDEALLLNHQGRLAEATAANVFIIRKGRLQTPPCDEGALPGIIRGAVLKGWQVIEAPITPKLLMEAEGAFLTNSLYGARALIAVDGAPIGQDAPAPIIAEIRRAMFPR